MKNALIALCAFLAVTTARVAINDDAPHHLLGGKSCTWGPSYWCQNITTAAGCGATKHCIESKWENMEVEEDHDSVCDICKDMVKQARDQLESNQTQEDLKAVFEGSCALIHVKVIVNECDRLVDQFIPELVETLASQMDPSVVCSVSGLCNSKHIDELLLQYQQKMTQNDEILPKSLYNDELEPDQCSKCYTIADHLEQKLDGQSRDEILENMLTFCGQFSSFSDACSSIVLTYFDTIYQHLNTEFKADNICHLSGQCSSRFHKHEEADGEIVEVEIRPLSTVGVVDIGDDLPCKLCEQLVSHLRDLLVANTTELEFQKVLEGLCKQTKSFEFECIAIVDEYYPEIYSYLTKELDGNAVCQMANVCPRPGNSAYNGPIWPLLPSKSAQIGEKLMNKKAHKLGENGAGIRHLPRKSEAEEMQLPYERMEPNALMYPVVGGGSKLTCAFCEYFLHFLQGEISNPMTEDEIKAEIGKVCTKLPRTVGNECKEFVDTYGAVLIAVIAQEIDPSNICPLLHLCPSEELTKAWQSLPKEMILVSEIEEKPSCPLCLLAVTQIQSLVKDNKTEASIEAALEKLCDHLPKSLTEQCTDLVKIYSKELVEMILADLSPQEVCVYIKLCDPESSPVPFFEASPFPMDRDGEIITNEIPDFPVYPVATRPEQGFENNAECAVCEFVMKHLEESIKAKSSRAEIEKIVHGVCHYLPKTVKQECDGFVNKYADLVIDMLVAEVNPKDICTAISLCRVGIEEIQASVAECALCQSIISTIDKELEDPKVENHIDEVIAKVCKYLPGKEQEKCDSMIKIYGPSIINLLTSYVDSKKICTKIALCSNLDYLAISVSNSRIRRFAAAQKQNEIKPCTWGSAWICASIENANQCNNLKFCQLNVWGADSPAEVQRGKEEKRERETESR